MSTLSYLIKPVSYVCNLDCPYCFYQRVGKIYKEQKPFISPATLKALFQKSFATNTDHCIFTWQGGEPMLLGLEYFKQIIAMQKELKQDFQTVENIIQTNGTLIDREWAAFFKENNILLGISIDGPKHLHDKYRFYRNKNGSFNKIMANIEILKEFSIPFNILTLLTKNNILHPKELYEFYQKNDFSYLQFIPYYEQHPRFDQKNFSVSGQELAKFYQEIFKLWYPQDIEKVSIRFFEDILLYLADGVHASCTWSDNCLSYIVVEHNGDCYPCDFYVYPEWKLGNIAHDTMEEIFAGEKRMRFAKRKHDLPDKCKSCKYLPFCNGDCPLFRSEKKRKYKQSHFCDSIIETFQMWEPIIPDLLAHVQRIRQS